MTDFDAIRIGQYGNKLAVARFQGGVGIDVDLVYPHAVACLIGRELRDQVVAQVAVTAQVNG